MPGGWRVLHQWLSNATQVDWPACAVAIETPFFFFFKGFKSQQVVLEDSCQLLLDFRKKFVQHVNLGGKALRL
jgi:hypothetical protein